MSKRRLFFLLALFLTAEILAAWGMRDTSEKPPALPAPVKIAAPDGEPPAGKAVVVTGSVRLVGSDMFSSLVLTDAAGRDWYLEGADREKLSKSEQRFLSIRGTPEYWQLYRADGKNAGIRRYLRNVSWQD